MINKKGQDSSKKQKDQLSVILTGLVIYSLVLIAIVIGSYIGIEYVINKNSADSDKQSVTKSEEALEEAVANTEFRAESGLVTEKSYSNSKIDVSDYYKDGYIDYDKVIINPAKRNVAYKWDDGVFSKLENVKYPSRALVNTYDFTRKTARCYEDKTVIFEIYSNPENGLIEKISELIYCGDEIETTDYYYDNGHINYIAQYREVINVPIDISSGAVQSRFYYANDTMVKYIYCENDKATEYNVASLKNYSLGTVEQYDYLESTMLNKAYINYYVVGEIPETEIVEGYVFDEFNSGISEAKVKLISEKSGEVVGEALTNGDGLYVLNVPIAKDDIYTAEITKDSLKECKVYGITAEAGSLIYDVEPVYLGYTENGAEYNVSIAVLDGKNKNNLLDGAKVNIRKGKNNRAGEIICETELDANGLALVTLMADNYTVEAIKDGYEKSYFNISVKADSLAGLGYTVPKLDEQECIVLLSWDNGAVQIGTDNLLDLDLRAFSSNANLVVKSSEARDASLPVEVIDVKNIGSDTYSYYVSDYNDCSVYDTMSYSMSLSSAKLYVFTENGMEALYHVPVAHCGVIWKPFELRNKKIININDYHYVCDEDSRWMKK